MDDNPTSPEVSSLVERKTVSRIQFLKSSHHGRIYADVGDLVLFVKTMKSDARSRLIGVQSHIPEAAINIFADFLIKTLEAGRKEFDS